MSSGTLDLTSPDGVGGSRSVLHGEGGGGSFIHHGRIASPSPPHHFPRIQRTPQHTAVLLDEFI